MSRTTRTADRTPGGVSIASPGVFLRVPNHKAATGGRAMINGNVPIIYRHGHRLSFPWRTGFLLNCWLSADNFVVKNAILDRSECNHGATTGRGFMDFSHPPILGDSNPFIPPCV